MGLFSWLFGCNKPQQAEGKIPSEVGNLRRWQMSGQPRAWVEAHHGMWDHQQWLKLLEDLRISEYWPMDPAAIGATLEEEKSRWQQRNQS